MTSHHLTLPTIDICFTFSMHCHFCLLISLESLLLYAILLDRFDLLESATSAVMGSGPNLLTESRAQILAFTKAGWSTRKIAKELSCSQSAVVKAKQRYNDTNNYKDRRRSGRPPKLTVRDLRTIIHDVRKNRRLSSREIKSDVNNFLKKNVGSSTIRRLLFKYGLKGRVARRKPFVSQVNRRKRLNFARNHVN